MGFLRYSLVGTIGTAVHYLLLIVSVQAAGAGPMLASTVGAAAGAIVNYAQNHRYTCVSRRRQDDSPPGFLTAAAAGMAVDVALLVALLAALLNGLGVYQLASQIVTTLAAPDVSRLASRAWTS